VRSASYLPSDILVRELKALLNMSTVPNRKHKFLSIKDKLNIVQRLSKGENGAFLAKIYGVGTSTISDIKAKKDSLQHFASKLDSGEGSQ